MRKSEAMQLCWPWTGSVTINCAVPVLAARSALPGKLAVSVRPFGAEEVTVSVQVATPAAADGTGVQAPPFEITSLAIADVSETLARTLGSIGATISDALNVMVAVDDWPTTIDVGASVTANDVVSGTTVSVPFTEVTA